MRCIPAAAVIAGHDTGGLSGRMSSAAPPLTSPRLRPSGVLPVALPYTTLLVMVSTLQGGRQWCRQARAWLRIRRSCCGRHLAYNSGAETAVAAAVRQASTIPEGGHGRAVGVLRGQLVVEGGHQVAGDGVLQ